MYHLGGKVLTNKPPEAFEALPTFGGALPTFGGALPTFGGALPTFG